MVTAAGDPAHGAPTVGSPSNILQRGLKMIHPGSPSSKGSTIPKDDLVEFGDLAGIEVSRGTDGSKVLHKPNDLGCRWNASAASAHSLAGACAGKPGPRGIAFVPTRFPSGGGYVLGLASAAGERHKDLTEDQSVASLDFAVHVASKGDFLSSKSSNLEIRESGSHKGTFGTFSIGDKVEVVLNDQGKVEYRVNSAVRHVSDRVPDYPLHVKLCACATGSLVRDVRWVGPGLLETAQQHAAQEEQHQRSLEGVEERLEQMAAHCRALEENQQQMLEEREALKKAHEQQLAALEARFDAQQKALRAAEGRLETAAEEREAQRARSHALDLRLAQLEESFHSKKHVTAAEERLAEHAKHLHGQLSASEEKLASHAREHARCAVEERHREHLDDWEARLARRTEAHSSHMSAVEECALERLRGRAGQAIQDLHEQRLRTAESDLAQLHRSLANEHLGASERKLQTLQRSLAVELERGIQMQLLEATRRARELELQVQAVPEEPWREEPRREEPRHGGTPPKPAAPKSPAPQPATASGPAPRSAVPAAPLVVPAAPAAPPQPSRQEAPEKRPKEVQQVSHQEALELRLGAEQAAEPRLGAEQALKERLKQLAAIEERMRLSSSHGPQSASPGKAGTLGEELRATE